MMKCSNFIHLHGCLVFLHHWPRRLSFLYSLFLTLLSRLIDCRCLDLFLGSLFWSVDLYVCICANNVVLFFFQFPGIFFYGYYNIFITFYWNIIALPYFVSFCCCVNHLYVYIYPLPLGPPSPCTPNSMPLGHHRASSWAPCAIQLPASYLFYTW